MSGLPMFGGTTLHQTSLGSDTANSPEADAYNARAKDLDAEVEHITAAAYNFRTPGNDLARKDYEAMKSRIRDALSKPKARQPARSA